MPETSQGDRTNPATPLRLERARDEGDIARSADLAFAIQLCGVIGIIWMLSGGIAAWLNQSTTRLWTTSSIRVDQFDSTAVMQQTIWSGSLIIAPILVLMMLVAVASWWLQTGPLWIVNKPAPDISRMSPATMVLTELVSNNAVAVIMATVSVYCQRQSLFQMAGLPADQMVTRMMDVVLSTALFVALAMLVTSVADYGLRWVSHQRKLQMSDQEIRDEQKMQGADNPFQAARAMRR
jgi:flagellar biosynthetic protein FlhB